MDRQAEQEVIARICRGERAAFGILVDAYAKPIFNLALRMTGHRADAEDLAQESFLRAFEQLHRFDRDRSFYTWLFTIALNVIRNHIKKTGRHRQAEDVHHHEAALGTTDGAAAEQGNLHEAPEADPLHEARETGLQRCLQELAPELRELLVLRFYQGLSFEAIAEITSLSQSAVKMRVYRGLEKLRKLMDGM